MGKVKKHTEYYCDICSCKISCKITTNWMVPRDRYYKIKCYDEEGKRRKNADYSYVCKNCMFDIIRKVKELKENANR